MTNAHLNLGKIVNIFIKSMNKDAVFNQEEQELLEYLRAIEERAKLEACMTPEVEVQPSLRKQKI